MGNHEGEIRWQVANAIKHTRDKAKKEFVVDNAAEYRRLKEKYERRDDRGRAIKPNFFGIIARKKGFYDNKKKNYKFHRTTMDYVQHSLNRLRFKNIAAANKPLIDVVDPVLSCDWSKVNYKQIDCIVDAVRECRSNTKLIWMSEMMDDRMKRDKVAELIESCSDYVLSAKLNSSTMYAMLKAVDRQSLSDVSSFLFNILFGSAESAFYQMINDSMSPIPIAVECLKGTFKLYDYEFAYHYQTA